MKIKGLITFAIGIVIGSYAAWYYTKTKYEEILQEEIDSVKAAFFDKIKVVNDISEAKDLKKETIVAVKVENKEADEYAENLKKYGYVGADMCGAEKNSVAPYIIAPEEFGEYEDYEKISLTYYGDGILADDNNEMVDDVDEVVGIDFFSHFGEYEDDSVFVRNDIKKSDYEILLDHRKYSDVIKDKPYLRVTTEYTEETW